MNVQARRLWAATEARAAGRGGVWAALRAMRPFFKTLIRGLSELESNESLVVSRIRNP
jgi:hypothetical protein